jgi:hypothetical protein
VEAAGGISRYFQSNAMHTEISIDSQPPLDPTGTPMTWPLRRNQPAAGHGPRQSVGNAAPSIAVNTRSESL